MIALILFVLILLIAVLAVGFMIGGRNGLPPASNQSSLNERRNQRTLVSPSSPTRTKPQSLIQPQLLSTVESSPHQTLPQQVGSVSAIIQPIIRQPIIVKPRNSTTTVAPAPVVRIKPIVTPHRTVVIQPQKAVTVMPSVKPAAIVSPSRAVTVEPPPRGAWDERGWTMQTDNRRETYEGYYTVGNRRFQGRIETKNRGRDVTAYIYNPPAEIKRHRHGACFQQVGNGWFLLHWARPARTVDDAILYMERVLDESLNG